MPPNQLTRRENLLPASNDYHLHIFEWTYDIPGRDWNDFPLSGVHRDEVADLRTPDVRVRIVQPSPRIVRRRLDLRWRRLAHGNISDQPHVISRAERGSDLVAYWLHGIFQDHLGLKQIVPMEPMIREWRDRGP